MSDERDMWVFDVQIIGRGPDMAEAWADAKLDFCENHVEPDKATFYPFDPYHKWKKGGHFTLPEIRAHIRAIAARHKEFRAFRIIEWGVTDGVQTIHDIHHFEHLQKTHKRYPYGSCMDNTLQCMVGKNISIEEVPISTWEHDR